MNEIDNIDVTHLSVEPGTGTWALGYDYPGKRRPVFSRIVTAARAGEALKRFIDRNFNRTKAVMPRFRVPVGEDDDDIVLSDYIDQAEQRADVGREMADLLHGDYAECGVCNLSHAHLPDCVVGKWLAAGGKTRFSV